jgi:hypothetical protein
MKQACTALEAGDFDGWLDVLLPYYDKTYAHSGMMRKGETFSFTLEKYNDQEIENLAGIKHELWNMVKS